VHRNGLPIELGMDFLEWQRQIEGGQKALGAHDAPVSVAAQHIEVLREVEWRQKSRIPRPNVLPQQVHSPLSFLQKHNPFLENTTS
jgi:hypothetical protein